MLPYPRPEDFDAEEPEIAERDALRGRQEIGDLEGCAQLVALLDSDQPPVLRDGANALYNLSLLGANADSLLTLGGLPKLCVGLEHPDAAVRAAMAGVLMNVCATSTKCRSELIVTGLLPQLLRAIAIAHAAAPAPAPAGVEAAAGGGTDDEAAAYGELEVRRNALGALNNLLLSNDAASQLREEGGIETLTTLLRDAGGSEARLEDAASSLLRSLQEDVKAGEAFVACGGMPVLVHSVQSPNEELQIRVCGLIFESCEQVPSARQTLHELKAVPAVLPLLTSSAEEVQEAAARAIEKLSRMPACAVAVRRSDGIPLLIDLMTSLDEGVQLAAVSAVMNVANSDPKAAAAIRDAEGLKPLVAFLTSANVAIQVAACTALLGCSKNEANKTILRELGTIDLLLKMLPFTNTRDAQAAAVATLSFLTLNEDEARVLLRLQGGMKKLQALLYANDPMLQAHSAEVFAHCAPNKDSRIAMRLADCLAPLVALLSSPHAAARLASAGALMQATQATRTNQVKCRELGSIAPLLRLLEPPEEGPPDREAQRRGVWTLSNIACEPTAAKQLRQSPSGFNPLIILVAGGDPILQRPAAACLFNATANDLGAPVAIESVAGLPALIDALGYAETNEHEEIVASSAGVLLNCAAHRGMANTLMSTRPDAIDRLFRCVSTNGYVPQVGNAIGAVMNVTAESESAVAQLLHEPEKTELLFQVLPALREEANVMCHIAGTIANLCIGSDGRDMLVAAAGGAGVRLLVETLESSEDDAQSCACCVALLNACHQHLPSREALLDCGGVQALVTALASDNIDVKAAAAGALLNCSATAGCAEAVRDAAAEFERSDGSKSVTPGFELLVRALHADQPLLRARAAGVLFNCAAFGPDTRMAMLEAGVVKSLADALVGPKPANGQPVSPAADYLGVPRGCPKELGYRIQANLIGAVLNSALNPTCKAELLKNGVMAPLVEAVKSADATVQSQASTAIAYLSDKAEPRPGSPISSMTSMEDPAAVTKTKLRFHETSRGSGGSGGSGAAGSSADGAGAPKPAVDDSDDTPGARSKALLGLMPRAKVSATHDSKSKAARFVQERPETYGRRLTTCVEPENMEEDYVEVPSPLPSPTDM
jgi:hypothetical protein